jgi:hypothetical protein
MAYYQDWPPGEDSGGEALIDSLFRACEQSLCALMRNFALNRSAANVADNMDGVDICDECRQFLCAIKIGTEVLSSLCVVASAHCIAPTPSLDERIQALLDEALKEMPPESIAECKRLIKRWCSPQDVADRPTAFLPLTRRTTM